MVTLIDNFLQNPLHWIAKYIMSPLTSGSGASAMSWLFYCHEKYKIVTWFDH